jgi:hypothetical protein
MPRSGTTLIEQVLASHPMVQGLGELVMFRNFIRSLGAEEGPLRPFRDAQSASLVEAYVENAKRAAPMVERTVDKFPGNYRYVPFIAALFPKARFIHCARDARDNAVSIFMEEFPQAGSFATSFEAIAHRQAVERRMMMAWSGRMADRMRTVVYENVVADPESEFRALLAFLELPWDEGVLRFFNTKRTVATPSKDQVRQPIYSTSVGRWRNYAPYAPELDNLVPPA